MLFSELLRITVLLVAGVATALAALSVLVIQNEDSTFAAIFGGGWWLIATVIGMVLGTSARAADAITPALRGARTATSLPSESNTRIAFMRLWPIGAFAIVCGVAGVVFPQVAVIGAGYALLIALLWRRREDAVRAIEGRDGVRFYVEPTSALEPIRLVRTPGLYRDRSPQPKPPPPPPEDR